MPERPPTDELYVGYLPVPAGQRSFLRWAVPVAVWMLCIVAYFWSRSQHSPGHGEWDQDHAVTLRGSLVSTPDPILFTLDPAGRVEAVLLVDMGKHGAASRAARFVGHPVAATGFIIRRGGRRMLELQSDDGAIVTDASGSPTANIPQSSPLGPVTLRGEIVDAKCFLGAMKPGDGKTHKDCATLCISGGIPAMFVAHDQQGEASTYLLQGPDGGPLDAALLPLIADPVEIHADLVSWGGLNVLRVRSQDVHRL